MADTKAYERANLKETLDISKWVFNLVYRGNPSYVKVYLISQFVESIYGIANTYILAKILDAVIKLVQVKGSLTDVYPYMLILLGINVLGSIAGAFRKYSQRAIELRTPAYLKRSFYMQIKGLGIQSMEQPEIANRITRVDEESYGIGSHFFRIISIFSFLASFLTSAIIIARTLPIVLPLMAAFYVPLFFVDRKFRRTVWKLGYDYTEERRKAYEAINPLSSPSALLEIFINNTHAFLDKKFTSFMSWFNDEQVLLRKKWVFGEYGFALLVKLGNYIGYILAFSQLLNGQITVGDTFFRVNLIDRLSSSMDELIQFVNMLFESTIRVREVYLLFHTKPAFEDGTIPFPKLTVGPEVSIQNLSFKYPNSEVTVLKNLTLKISSGEKIAIVGVNGAGKTTLVKLLAKIYLPTYGKVLVNGLDLSEVKMNDWYENLGVLFQNFNTYPSLTVKENVQTGYPTRPLDEKAFVEALERADALDFVNDYPKKLDQILGEQYTGGIRPSTGQWQKLAISRFFYRDAPMVIYDEPTASIDAVSEYNIFNKIYSFFEGKTVIIISHRFSTVRNADRIIVLDKGAIVEEGSHEELMKKEGHYAKSFKLQAEGYSTAS